MTSTGTGGQDEATLLSRIQEEYNRFIQVMSEAITMVAGGGSPRPGMQRTQATPWRTAWSASPTSW